MTRPVVLILAAGASSRMRGADKLMQPVAGVPLLRHLIRVAQASGAPVLVALPPGDSPRRDLAEQAGAVDACAGLTGVGLVNVSDAGSGMAASICAGVAAVPGGSTGLLLMLADMPEIETADLLHLLKAHAADATAILRAASHDGVPGHPILFPAQHFPALCRLQGDMGARAVLAAGRVRLIPLPGSRALTDLDTPEDWLAWRAQTGL